MATSSGDQSSTNPITLPLLITRFSLTIKIYTNVEMYDHSRIKNSSCFVVKNTKIKMPISEIYYKKLLIKYVKRVWD